MILCKKDDEDKGSSLQNGVNSFAGFDTPLGLDTLLRNYSTNSGYSTSERRKSKVQRKPFGCAITRQIFPSKDNFAHNTARVIARSKGIGLAKKIQCRCEEGALPDEATPS